MSRAQIPLVVQSPSNGSAIVGATVRVNDHATGSPSTIYTSETASATLGTNVITTDANGRCTNAGNPLWLASGTYDFQISGTNLTTYSVTRELISANAVVSSFMPAGCILPYAGSVLPAGWLWADGSAQSRTTYALLYAALGGAFSPWGQGDRSSTFNVPNLPGRTLVGAGTGSGLTSRVLATTGGAETHTHTGSTPDHQHTPGTLYTPDHYHAASLAVSLGTASRGSPNGYSAGAGESVAFTNHVHSGSAAGNTGGSSNGNSTLGGMTGTADRSLAFTTAASSSMQPFVVVNFIISTGVQ